MDCTKVEIVNTDSNTFLVEQLGILKTQKENLLKKEITFTKSQVM